MLGRISRFYKSNALLIVLIPYTFEYLVLFVMIALWNRHGSSLHSCFEVDARIMVFLRGMVRLYEEELLELVSWMCGQLCRGMEAKRV